MISEQLRQLIEPLEALATDYALGWSRAGEYCPLDVVLAFQRGECVPILAMADGPVGVIRALATRCGHIDVRGPRTVAAARLVDGKPRLDWWIVKPAEGGAA